VRGLLHHDAVARRVGHHVALDEHVIGALGPQEAAPDGHVADEGHIAAPSFHGVDVEQGVVQDVADRDQTVHVVNQTAESADAVGGDREPGDGGTVGGARLDPVAGWAAGAWPRKTLATMVTSFWVTMSWEAGSAEVRENTLPLTTWCPATVAAVEPVQGERVVRDVLEDVVEDARVPASPQVHPLLGVMRTADPPHEARVLDHHPAAVLQIDVLVEGIRLDGALEGQIADLTSVTPPAAAALVTMPEKFRPAGAVFRSVTAPGAAPTSAIRLPTRSWVTR
jgi:hypothetical protein